MLVWIATELLNTADNMDTPCCKRKRHIPVSYTHLPITTSGEIDFEFMESFIAELEAERIAELEAYLLATGLTDYILTAEEKAVLQAFRDGKNGGGI